MSTIRQISLTSQTLHNAIKPLLIYSKLFGLVCFRFTKNGYENSKINVIINAIAILSYISFTIYGMILRVKYGGTTTIMTTTDMMLTTGCLIQTLIAWGTSALYQRKYIHLLNKIVETDRKFKELGVWIFYDKTAKIIIIRIIFHTLFIIIIASLYTYFFSYLIAYELIIFNISALISSIINLLIIEQVSVYVLILKNRFKILNEHLQDLQKKNIDAEEISNIKLTSPLSTKLRMLRIICPIHHELTKAGKIINEVFGLQLLITFGVIFVSITVGLYYVCIYIQQDMEDKWESVFGSFLLALNYIVDTLLLCYACHSTIEEVNNSGRLLHQIEYTDDDVKDQIEMFSLQIVNENLHFSAVGFFPVDYTLIFSIIGGITTYLIILIQFSSGPGK